MDLDILFNIFPRIFAVIVIGVIFFLIFRELVTWYWKLNRIIELLEEIKENTRPKEKNPPNTELDNDTPTDTKTKQKWW
ncbi:MAG: hypothetical protein WDZ88_03840 [Candidatus Paceibacterota bacterium]